MCSLYPLGMTGHEGVICYLVCLLCVMHDVSRMLAANFHQPTATHTASEAKPESYAVAEFLHGTQHFATSPVQV